MEQEPHKVAAERIKEICKERGINPAQFGRMVGVSRQQVYRWFSLVQRMPDLKIEKSAEVLNVHPAELRYAVQPTEIDQERLLKILTDIFEQVESRGATLTPAQLAHLATTLYAKGDGDTLDDFLKFVTA